MRGHTSSSINRPHLDLAIERSAQQILASITPINREDPCRVSREIRNLLSVLNIIQCNDSSISSSCQTSARWREGNCPYSLYQTCFPLATPYLHKHHKILTRQRIQHPSRIIIKHINRAILMPACRKPPIPTHINTHAKTALRLILPNLLPVRHQIPNIDASIIRRARQILPIFT